MRAYPLAANAVLVVLAVDIVLLTGLLALKWIHRHRVIDHDRRRAEYVALLSRHLTIRHNTELIGPKTAEDPAFLDALIDVRNAVNGPEIDTLHGIVGRYGIVQDLGRRLQSRFPLGRRLQAAVALAELGDESSASLMIRHLGDPEPEVRIQCARGLGRMRWTPAIDAIVERFNIEDPWVRSRFADTLIGFGAKATWPLLAYIRVNHRFESEGPAAAVLTLAAIDDRQAAGPLTEVLYETEDPEIRLAVIEALGILGGPMVVDTLTRYTGSEDWRVRAKTASALGGIGDDTALPFLIEGLEDSNWWVRRNSAAALTRLPSGQDALYDALSGPDRYARDASAEALADAGELAAARRRMEEGTATERHVALLAHMAGEQPVSA